MEIAELYRLAHNEKIGRKEFALLIKIDFLQDVLFRENFLSFYTKNENQSFLAWCKRLFYLLKIRWLVVNYKWQLYYLRVHKLTK